jgi:hypothetical protein
MQAIADEVRDLESCPYCDTKAEVCEASVTALKIESSVRFNRCNSENYDNCALFLAKCLRKGWQQREVESIGWAVLRLI